MPHDRTVLFGIEVPSSDPVFLTVVGLHVLAGLVCVVAGAVAMVSDKRPGWHPEFGTIYYWSLSGVFVSATALSVVRWGEDYHLFILGAFSFAAASLGRTVRRQRRRGWVRLHIPGMGLSYILLLTAFYVDNGPNLPLWRELPQITFWVLPSAIGLPIVMRTLLLHPLVRRSKGPA